MQAWRTVMAHRGVAVSDEVLRSIVGVSDAEFLRDFLAERRIDGSVDEWLAAKRGAYLELIRGGVRPFPGAVELVRELSARMPVAVATSSSRIETETCLGHVGLGDRLAAVVTKEDVSRHKPAPDAFLLAAQRMGVEPWECVAFEDSLAGIAAASGATMLCIAVTNSFPASSFVCAELIVGSLANTAPIFELIFGDEGV